jgi:hypothetical protein
MWYIGIEYPDEATRQARERTSPLTAIRRTRSLPFLLLVSLVAGLLVSAALAARPGRSATAAQTDSEGSFSECVVMAARPEVELVASREEHVALRFSADESSRFGSASTYVRVPDTGRIEIEVESMAFAGAPGEPEAPDPEALGTLGILEVSEPAVMRDLRLVRVIFSPATAGDRSGGYVRELTLSLRTVPGLGINEKRGRRLPTSEAFERLYEGTVINYDARDTPEAGLAADGGGSSDLRDPLPLGARYLVISADTYADEIEPLVEWKNAKGMRSMLTTLSSIGTSAEQIKYYIQNAYDTWDIPPEYVLLVGDTEQLPSYESLTWTDNYYATLEGSDFLSDVMVGRISADSGYQCSIQVAKILGYERTPVTTDPDWPTSALLMVHDDFDGGDWIYYMNTWRIYDQLDAAGFAPIDTLFHRNEVSRSQVYASVNDGKGFLNFRGQAWINWLSPFDINAYNTTNGWKLPVVVSATCATGIFEDDGFICEDWVRAGSPSNPKGGVAFFATNTAFAGSEELSLKRGYVDEGFFDGLFEDGGRTLGEGCLAGKMRLYLKVQDQVDYEGWNLLGDPEMNVWKATPHELEALHDGGTQIGQSDFVVTVLSGGSLHEGALVACVKDDEVYSTAYTDATGRAVLPIAPTTTGTMTVVATDENAVPYEGTALVLDSGPFVVYSDVGIEDAATGNDDGELNTGETTDVAVALSNIGNENALAVTARLRIPHPEVTVVDSVATYGDIAAGTTEWGSDLFRVEVSDGCDNGTLVSYSVAVYVDGAPAGVLNPAPLEVVTAELSHVATLCEDDGPGADGDGSPGAGETVGLVITLENTGPSGLTDVHGTISSADPKIEITLADAPFSDAPALGACSNAPVAFILSVSPTATNGQVVTLTLDITGDGQTYQYSKSIDIPLVLTGSSVAAPVGPDAYGYYAYDRADSAYGPAPSFDWYDIAPPGPGNLITAITDEDAGITTMGTLFPIRYYGQSENLISVSSNGFLAVGATDYRFGDNSTVPDSHGPPNMVAGFWDDLDPSAGGDIYSWMDFANHRLIVQYDEVRHWNSPMTETFQVIFYNENYHPTPTNDSPILFLYEDVSMPYGCTVAIENYYQDIGLEYLFDSDYASNAAPIEAGAAVLFTTIEPVDPGATWLVLTGSSIDDSEGGNGDGIAQIGETVGLTLQLTSVAGSQATDVSVELTAGESMLEVVDGTAVLPDVPAGGTSQNTSDPLTFFVTDTVPDTVATLWASISANGGAYIGSGRVDVHIDLSATGVSDARPSTFSLRPSYPNPFASRTSLELALPAPERVTARVYSPSGRLVRTLLDDRLPAGEHLLHWDGRDAHGHTAASGVYFVRLDAGANTASRKVVLLR